MRRTSRSPIFNIGVGEREIICFVKSNPATPRPWLIPGGSGYLDRPPTILFIITEGTFRNTNLTQYSWLMHKFSINKFRKIMRRASRSPFFNICIGEREITYFVKNWQKSPDPHWLFVKKRCFLGTQIPRNITKKYIVLMLIDSEKGHAEHLEARFLIFVLGSERLYIL